MTTPTHARSLRTPLARPRRAVPKAHEVAGHSHRHATPVGGWRRMFGDSLLVSGATLIAHAFGAVTSLLLRMLLTPSQMGIWQGLKLFLSYGNYAGLGVSKAAAREVSLARGSGDREHAEYSVRLAYSVNTVTSLLYALALGVGAVWIGVAGADPLSLAWAVGLAAVALLTLLQRYTTFLITVHRADGDFRSTSIVNVIEALLTLPAMALGAWWFGLPGLYAATLVVLLGTLVYLRKQKAISLAWAWDNRQIRRLIGIGGPILLAGIASSLFRSLDKLMILGYLSDKEYQLGCYSLGLMVCTQLYGLANMLAGVMSPRYGETFGLSGNHRDVARLAAAASEIQAAAVALPAGLAIAAAPPLLAWLLPDYREGIAALVWLVPGILASSLAIPASQYLVAVNRGRSALGVLLISMGVLAFGNHLALTRGGGLVSVAIVTTIADITYLALILAVSFWPHLSLRERVRYVLGALLPLTAVWGLALTIHRQWYHATDPVGSFASVCPDVIAAGALIGAAWAAVAGLGWYFGGWRENLRPDQAPSSSGRNRP